MERSADWYLSWGLGAVRAAASRLITPEAEGWFRRRFASSAERLAHSAPLFEVSALGMREKLEALGRYASAIAISRGSKVIDAQDIEPAFAAVTELHGRTSLCDPPPNGAR